MSEHTEGTWVSKAEPPCGDIYIYNEDCVAAGWDIAAVWNSECDDGKTAEANARRLPPHRSCWRRARRAKSNYAAARSPTT